MLVSKKYDKAILICFFIMACVLMNLFLFERRHNEQYIYFWDASGYWTKALALSERSLREPLTIINDVYNSILYDEYSLLPALFFVPLFKLINGTSAVFAMGIFTMFITPFVGLMYLFIERELEPDIFWKKLIIMLMLFTSTSLITPLLLGYLDSVGLVAAAGMLLTVQSMREDRLDPKHIIILSVLTLAICFLRRWYGFYVVGFYISFFLAKAIRYGKRGLTDKRTLYTFLNLFLSGALWLAILLLFFRQFLFNSLMGNLSFAYSAYKTGDILDDIAIIFKVAGYFMALFATVGVAYALCKKDFTFPVFFIVQAALMLYLFSRIQSLGVQHAYLFTPGLLYLSSYGLLGVFDFAAKAKKYLPVMVGAASALIFILNFYNAYFWHQITPINAMKPFIASWSEYKHYRSDIAEINRLVDDLNSLSKNERYCYTLASSPTLNSDLLNNAKLPQLNAVDRLFYSPSVDLRDGFPYHFFVADIIIVADPVQYHLGEENQRIMVELAESILSGEAGGSLRLIDEYTLENDVTAKIFERVMPYTHEYLQNLEDRISQYYPDMLNALLTSPLSYFHGLDISNGGDFSYQEKDAISLYGGVDGAGFLLNLEGKFNKISFSVESDSRIEVELIDENGMRIYGFFADKNSVTHHVGCSDMDIVKLHIIDAGISVRFSDLNIF